jgi:hypothetical protein
MQQYTANGQACFSIQATDSALMPCCCFVFSFCCCRHGRATFSVLLFQDLAVVVLLMLIPLLAPDPSGASSGGMAKIATVSAQDRGWGLELTACGGWQQEAAVAHGT